MGALWVAVPAIVDETDLAQSLEACTSGGYKQSKGKEIKK